MFLVQVLNLTSVISGSSHNFFHKEGISSAKDILLIIVNKINKTPTFKLKENVIKEKRIKDKQQSREFHIKYAILLIIIVVRGTKALIMVS